MNIDFPSYARKLVGFAFEIPDLLLAQAFAEACGLRIIVETDHHTTCEELEEVLAVYHPARGSDACHCLIWRSPPVIVVQPIPGRARQFPSLADALEWLELPSAKASANTACHPRQQDSVAIAAAPE